MMEHKAINALVEGDIDGLEVLVKRYQHKALHVAYI